MKNINTENRKWSSTGLDEKDLEGFVKTYATVLQSNIYPGDEAIEGKCSEDVLLKMSFRTEYGQHLNYEGHTTINNMLLLRDLTRYKADDLQGKTCIVYIKDDTVKEVVVNINLLP